MSANWWNNYVGIPYKIQGRTRFGVDCWGLLRLVYKEQYDIQLPSFDIDYASTEDSRILETMAREREIWEQKSEGKQGDLILFRIKGRETHVGIYLGNQRFLHSIAGKDSCIERLDGTAWKHRFVTFAEYRKGVAVSGRPNPLKTQRVETTLPEGCTIQHAADFLKSQANLGFESRIVMMLDGRPIPAELWETTTLRKGQVLEYRAVPTGGDGDSLFRAVVVIAIMVVAAYYAPTLFGSGAGASFSSLTLAQQIGVGIVMVAASYAANRLALALFPIRPRPPVVQDAIASALQQNLLQGGANGANRYGSIPVCLGRYRYSPPLASNTFVEADATTSYLRMMLAWGYGPLDISDLRIGVNRIDSYEEVSYETVLGYATDSYTRFDSIYGQDVYQFQFNQVLTSNGTEGGSPWVEHSIPDASTRLGITLHFPEGLRSLNVRNGATGEAPFRGQLSFRPLDNVTLAPTGPWQSLPGTDVGLPTAYGAFLPFYYYDENGSPSLISFAPLPSTPVYRWSRVLLDTSNRIVVRNGDTSDIASAPGSTLHVEGLRRELYIPDQFTYTYFPGLNPGEKSLYDFQVYGTGVVTTVDNRAASGVTGYGLLSLSARVFRLNDGTFQENLPIALGAASEEYSYRKDAFTKSYSFEVPLGKYEVRVRRTNSDVGEVGDIRYLHQAVLVAVSGYENRKPTVNPPGVYIAKTAIRIKASNQFNNNVEGISATVTSVVLDWDKLTATWVLRPSRNPASLVRHVWQHPGNAQRLLDAQIDLETLQDFHEYCELNQFTYDQIHAELRSVQDVLADICAAGRASPTVVDGKHTVIIDRERTSVAQHFTPHNSWGFEGTKSLPKYPHAFRVKFINARTNYQQDEMIVYADGYDISNATIFEGLELPGVTEPVAVYKHARFHLAQLILRPESYVLNVDIENLVCTRGDLVKVAHDVPMWGLATGRIKTFINSTTLELDEEVPLEAGKAYVIRIRRDTGATVVLTLVSVLVDGYYREISLLDPTTEDIAKPSNLFMLGENLLETNELVVLSIESSDNITARLTLVDYSPAVYLSDTQPIPLFVTKITTPPRIQANVITAVPAITSVVSDETVMSVIGPGQYSYKIRVTFTNPATLPAGVVGVEGQIDFAADSSDNWSSTRVIGLAASSIDFLDVQEAATYKLRIRYYTAEGRNGPWVEFTETVVGKTTPPAVVTGAAIAIEGSQLRLTWDDNTEIDLAGYEIRTADTGWGTPGNHTYTVSSELLVLPAVAGTTGNWYIRALDSSGIYSLTSAVLSYYTPYPDSVVNFVISGLDLSWSPSFSPFGLAGYSIRFQYGNNDNWVNASYVHEGLLTSSPYSLLTRPTGNITLLVKGVDVNGNESLNPAVISVNLGDIAEENILIQYPQAPGFSGVITGGSVDAGVLKATQTDQFYGSDSSPFYGPDTDAFYSLLSFAELVYDFEILTLNDFGRLVLNYNIVGSNFSIQYQRGSLQAFFGDTNDFFYGADSDGFYGAESALALWPGSIDVIPNEKIRFVVTIVGSSEQGLISLLTPFIDVIDISETVDDVVISAAGTRIPIALTYRVIKNVQMTVQSDGNGGLGARIEDKDSVLGPLVTVRNKDNVAVDGLIDATVQGY